MKTEEIKNLSDKEIAQKAKESRIELLTLRVRKQTGQVDKPHRIKQLRRLIARFETSISQRALQVAG